MTFSGPRVISFAGSVHESIRIKQELEDLVSSLDMTMPLPVLSTEELSHRGRLAGTRQTAQTTLRAQQWLNRVVTVWVKIAGLAKLNVCSCTWLSLMNVAHNTWPIQSIQGWRSGLYIKTTPLRPILYTLHNAGGSSQIHHGGHQWHVSFALYIGLNSFWLLCRSLLFGWSNCSLRQCGDLCTAWP